MNYILYDLEATCWLGRPPKGIQEIIEIGAVKVNGYGEVVSEFNKFVRPTVNTRLSSFCTRLTTITQKDVDRANTFPKVAEEFKDWIGVYDEDFTLGSWGIFDIQMLRKDCELHKMETDWLSNFIDVKEQYRVIKNLEKGTGLKNTTRHEGFEFTGKHHRAISDAQNLAKIFIKYLDDWVVVG